MKFSPVTNFGDQSLVISLVPYFLSTFKNAYLCYVLIQDYIKINPGIRNSNPNRNLWW